MAARQSGLIFGVMSRSRILCKFLSVVEKKQLSGTLLEREAKIFWTWCTLKGFNQCPFPEYLIKFVNGDWDPCEK